MKINIISFSDPQLAVVFGYCGACEVFATAQASLNVVRHAKGSEGDLSRWINCCVSNAGTGDDFLHGIGRRIANVSTRAARP